MSVNGDEDSSSPDPCVYYESPSAIEIEASPDGTIYLVDGAKVANLSLFAYDLQ
jgi:hypothetical protein